MAELLVVRSKIKDYTKCNVAGDFADALSKKVEAMIKEAEARAESNKRRTIMSHDIWFLFYLLLSNYRRYFRHKKVYKV